MGFTECTLKVGIAPLRAAITSVVVHAAKVRLGDEDLELSRVRLIAGKTELLVVATNGTAKGNTCAQAAVTIEADDRRVKFEVDDGPFVIDLHPAKARDIVRQIKPVKTDAEGDPGPSATGWCNLTLDADDETVTVVDESGLWPGTRLTVPALEHRDDFPDIPGILGRALSGAAGTFKPLITGNGVVPLFDVAAKEYDAELEIEPTGTADSGGFVVICGDFFTGVLESGNGTGNSLKARDKRRFKHLERLGVGNRLQAV